MYDLYAVCVAGLNRLIPRHLSEPRLVYGQLRACGCRASGWGFVSTNRAPDKHSVSTHLRRAALLRSSGQLWRYRCLLQPSGRATQIQLRSTILAATDLASTGWYSEADTSFPKEKESGAVRCTRGNRPIV